MSYRRATPECRAYDPLRRLLLDECKARKRSVRLRSYHYPIYIAIGSDLGPCWIRVVVRFMRRIKRVTWQEHVAGEDIPLTVAWNAVVAKAVYEGIRRIPPHKLALIDNKPLRAAVFEIREEVDTRTLRRMMRAIDDEQEAV